jgi:peptidoglycan hydrolase-like protein with peptidoglycan-binding domain
MIYRRFSISVVVLALALAILSCDLSGTRETPRPPPEYPGGELYFQYPNLTHTAVQDLETRLMELDYQICVVSSFYTAQTESAVKRFQELNHLNVDGIVHQQTWDRLFSSAAEPAPQLKVNELSFKELMKGVDGISLTSDGTHLWVIASSRQVDVIDMAAGKRVGKYAISALPGEEDYVPEAIAFDGTNLWVVSQSLFDAILQAYDPQAGLKDEELKPLLSESIYLDSPSVSKMSFDGQRLWVVVEGSEYFSNLIPVDPRTRELGQIIEIGEKVPGSAVSVEAPAFFGQQLWLPVYGDLGHQAIRPLDRVTGYLGEPLGVCGSHIVSDGRRLWIAKGYALWAVDPLIGRVDTIASLGDSLLRAITFDGARLWVIDWDDTLWYLDLP